MVDPIMVEYKTICEFDDQLQEIADYYGEAHQFQKLIEEAAECIVEITHLSKARAEGDLVEAAIRRRKYIEELADLNVIWHTLYSLLTAKERNELIEIQLYKAKRECERIAKKKEKKE